MAWRAGRAGDHCWEASGRWNKETHSVGDAISESHKLDLILGALPVREEGENQTEGGCLGFGGAVGEGNVAEGGRDAVLRVVGAHGWQGRMRIGREARQNQGRRGV
jgi:hypothetical protein